MPEVSESVPRFFGSRVVRRGNQLRDDSSCNFCEKPLDKMTTGFLLQVDYGSFRCPTRKQGCGRSIIPGSLAGYTPRDTHSLWHGGRAGRGPQINVVCPGADPPGV